jgi:thioredoxin reductase (NADPH)
LGIGAELFISPETEAGGEQAASDSYDVVVIGGGPAGVTAAIYAARAELETLVIDKGLRVGALGMASKIVNYPGVPAETTGAELLGRMRAQAEGFGARFIQDRVVSTDLQGSVKQVWGSRGVYRGRTVIIATGSMGRTNVVAGEERMVGKGVSYCATCDGAFFRDREVAVAGNNDEALEEALFLTRFAERVHLLANTPALRASADLVAEAENHPRIQIHLTTSLREVVGEQLVEGVRISSRGGEESILPVSGAFIYLQGGRPITDYLDGELKTTEDGCLEVDGSMQTGVAGVFAVGDVLCSHLKQVVIAAGEGATAAMSAERYLSGRSRLRPDWS